MVGLETGLAWLAIVLAGLAILFQVAFFVLQIFVARSTSHTIIKDNAEMTQNVTRSIAKIEGIQEYLQNIYRPTLDALIEQRGPSVAEAVQTELAESVGPTLEAIQARLQETEGALDSGHIAAAEAAQARELVSDLRARMEQIGEEAAEKALHRLSTRAATPVMERPLRIPMEVIDRTLKSLGGQASTTQLAETIGPLVSLRDVAFVLSRMERTGKVAQLGRNEWALPQPPLELPH